jgi:hypothetical protein
VTLDFPAGQEPDLWQPDPEEQTHRFVLGNVSRASIVDPPLIAICMNPSRADRTQSDKTVNRLIEASTDNGYPGWIMLNLYPQRATKPSDLSPFDSGLSAANCAAIEQTLLRFQVVEVLGAWGGQSHKTLRQAKPSVLDTLDRLGVRLYMWDGLTKTGNPFHPTPRRSPLLMQGTKRYLTRIGNRHEEVKLGSTGTSTVVS